MARRAPILIMELEVRKVPKVTGEVVVRTRQETELAEQDVHLRKERVDVEQVDATDAQTLNSLNDTDDDLDAGIGTTGTGTSTRSTL